jgi:hypothetical protein
MPPVVTVLVLEGDVLRTTRRSASLAIAAAPGRSTTSEWRVEHLEDAGGGGDRLLQVRVDAAQLLGRLVGQEQRGDERR